MEKELYFAFISYKHADKDWAMWLQKSLQEYRLPTRTIKEHSGLPKRLSPIFIDQQYLRPGQLEEELQKEVAASKFLIVVCSKAAHQESHYLDDEIHYFLNSGHSADHIIPFIIDPSNAPEKECFPLALQEVCKEHNLLGANIYENGKKRAFLKTVAQMLDIRLTELANADEQRKRNHIIAAVCSALLCIGIVTGVGIYHYNYYIPHTAYYLDYAVHGGVPEGIHKLKKSETAGMHSVVALTSCEGKVTTLRNEDSNGNLVEISSEYQYVYDRPVMETYEYADQELLKSTAYDQLGKVVYTKDYKNSSTIDFTRTTEEGYSSSIFRSSDTAGIATFGSSDDAESKSSIVRYLVDYDADGYESEIRYVSNSNTNTIAANGDGIFGMRFIRDAKKRITEVQYLSCKDTKYATNKNKYYVSATKAGISGVRYEYNDQDQLACVSFCDLNGSPILNEDGYASVQFMYNAENNVCQENFCGTDGKRIRTVKGAAVHKMEYDSQGNEISFSYYDENENPVLSDELFSKVTAEYDDRGHVLCYQTFGLNDKLVLNKYGWAKRVMEYDEAGNQISDTYYGPDGKITLSSEGLARWIGEYDDKGNNISGRYYGTDGQPILCSEGYAKWVAEYDEHGNTISCSYYGTDGQPTLSNEGYAKWVAEYDERGNEVSCSFYGTDGQLTLSNEQIAKWVSEYDERGNKISNTFYGTDGQPTLSNEQYAKWVSEYDERGNEISCSYFGTDGQLILRDEGCAKVFREYDDHGNRISCSFYGTDGQPILCSEGYAKWVSEYDERGNEISCSYFGTDGQPILCSEGCAKWVKEYDERGNNISGSYYGTDGYLILCNGSYAKWACEYDERGNRVSCSFFDTDGRLTLNKEQIAKWVREYDERGNEISCSFYGTDSQLILCEDGYAKRVSEYDERGNEISVSYYGTDGQLILNSQHIARSVREYDEVGNKISSAYYDTDGQLVLRDEGYAKNISEYDERRNQISCVFYGTDGQLILCTSGYAKWVKTYDGYGNEISCAFYGTDGQLILCNDGYAKWIKAYDEHNHEISCSCYGTDGKLILNSSGYAEHIIEYDERGNEISCVYYGIDGLPVLCTSGYAKWVKEYDERGNAISCSFYDTDGQPVLCKSGYAKWVKEYDERGNTISCSYYGTDEQLILRDEGYSKWVSEYDKRGNEISCSFYGTDGQLVLCTSGYAKSVKEYDERGNTISCSFYDRDDQPVIRKGGYFKWTREYDTRNKMTNEALYDTQNNKISETFYDSDGNKIGKQINVPSVTGFSVKNCGRFSVHLFWDKVSLSSHFIYYELEYQKNDEDEWKVLEEAWLLDSILCLTTSCDSGILENGSTYNFRIRPYITEKDKNYGDYTYLNGIKVPEEKQKGVSEEQKIEWEEEKTDDRQSEDSLASVPVFLSVKAGDHILFGHYPQTESGTDNTPIEWRVLDVQGNKALVISEYGLDAQPYNAGILADITWKICSLRIWLNNDFLNRAFNKTEQTGILRTVVNNDQSQSYYGTFNGNDTQDKIFLLSYTESNKYFGVTYENDKNIDSRVEPTEYAIRQGAWTDEECKTSNGKDAGWWWLRSSGEQSSYASFVLQDGTLDSDNNINVEGIVRPAMWIDLSAAAELEITAFEPTPTPEPTPTLHPADELKFSVSMWSRNDDGFVSEYGDTVNLADLEEGQYYTPVLKVTNDSGHKVIYNAEVKADGESLSWKTTELSNDDNNQKYISKGSVSNAAGEHTAVYSIDGREVCTFKWTIIGIPKDTPIPESELFSGSCSLNAGDHILFGTYPQTTEGTDNTPVEWRVLDVQDRKALVVSEYGLDVKSYNTEYVDTTWEQCSLRVWLNDDFLNKAFSREEQTSILITNVDNSKSQRFDWSTVNKNSTIYNECANTKDRIFLLSYAEAHQYLDVNNYYDDKSNGFPNRKARVEPTAYANKQGAYRSSYKTNKGNASGWWWLRSPGGGNNSASVVFYDGSLRGSYVDDHNEIYSFGVVRPAFWLDLTALNK